jgi:pimeloyl-ACP methyl ester carboxylesterase
MHAAAAKTEGQPADWDLPVKNQGLWPLQKAMLNRYAPGARTHRLRWSGGTTQALELGEGPPLLLVHGGFGNAFDWAPLMPALAQKRRVVAVDRPGHGLADPFDYRGVDLWAHGATFIAEVLDALGIERADLAANSMGGLWSVSFAMARPERVSALILVGAPAGMKRELPLALRMMRFPVMGALVRALMRRPTRKSTRDFWRRIVLAHPERVSDEHLDASAASQRANCESWFGLAERAMDAGGLRRELVIGERWERLRVPFHFVWGERDAVGPPAEARAVASRVPGVRVLSIADAGHLPWLDDLAATAQAISTLLP